MFRTPVMMQFNIRLLVCSWALLPLHAAFLDNNPCVCPFIYEGKSYSSCTKDGSKFDQLWCATTFNYDKDHQWKKCHETEHGGNSHGKPCVFPFIYRKRKFFTCTDENVKPMMFWCATTMNYDEDKKWSYCADTYPSCLIGSSMAEKRRREDSENLTNGHR